MSDPVPHIAYDSAQNFSQFQLKALADWAKGMSDSRLAIVQKQLNEAVLAYDEFRDVALVGLALAARGDAVNHEVESRGGVAMPSVLIVPWGKSIADVEKWTLTDYTKLPSPEDRGIVVQTEERPLCMLLEGFTPGVSEAVREHIPNNNHPSLSDNSMIIDSDNANHFDQFVKLPDLVNDYDEAESYRKAENDFSGLPIISSEVIDVDSFSHTLEGTFFAETTTLERQGEDNFHTPVEDPMDIDVYLDAVEPLTQSPEAQVSPEDDDDGDVGYFSSDNLDERIGEPIDPSSLRTE